MAFHLACLEISEELYVYTDLPTDEPESIRLLKLCSGPNEPIKVSLQVANLDKNPQYDCLSYTWADPLYHGLSAPADIQITNGERSIPILCDGLILKITSNLQEALKELINRAAQDTERQNLIWIDAICINQYDEAANKKEKGHQINMMGSIYSAAKSVIVWLGITDEHSKPAIEAVNLFSTIEPETFSNVRISTLFDDVLNELTDEVDIEWLSLAAFLQRTWFSRIWVVQEVFLPTKILVLCGSSTLTWSAITACSRFLRATNLGNVLMEEAEKVTNPNTATETVYVKNILSNQYIFESMREQKRADRVLNLEQLLSYSRYFNATEAQDHVFALYGIWAKSLPKEKIPERMGAELKESVARVYTRATLESIRETGDLNILSLVEDASVRAIQLQREGLQELSDLPSWVPDYRVVLQPTPLSGNPRLTGGDVGRWNASAGLIWEIPISVDNSAPSVLLPVKGVCFDTISEISKAESEIMGRHQLKSILYLLSNCPSTYPDGSTTIEAFYRTLIKDTYLNQPASSSARLAFPYFILMRVLELEVAMNNEPEQYTTQMTETKSLIQDLCSRPDNNGIIPSWEMIEEMRGKIEDEDKPPELTREINDIHHGVLTAVTARRLFRCGKGWMGITAESVQVGDVVWVLAGMKVPVVLRSVEGKRWKVVGEGYVHGIMNGEGIRGREKEVDSIDLE
ncbi:hypothetical protein GLAREA_07179 [Glarea lozoyensis ATCC 20868]|uniref:Heterokaryon incompatibility domain-containing protein n=1 Tax=Glarea lozoyensis (strain ATCC 20868 / MF5171) TaxID=1116229 RepID=S3DQ26_GLAL2|nr:uncharacterized protein GLAREA_07179 [Glarea lozoyensis ATCC 20868]EPE34166.1 hypothetical protein GLAREA_07179 [Glarea lozoyensis ATCC 20868]